MTKFIFVTGGVVSSLGKGITVASIGRMLKSRGLTVSVLKLDPYLNVDPGTMSPYQHGEVFVTIDGSETDLDLGHYERFIDVELTELSNVTAGQIYSEVISNERAGHYLGGTIQTVPHVTNLIKDRVLRLAEKSQADVVIVEVGGTVGDIEGQPFIEAIRQVRNVVGSEDTYYIHVTLLPYLGATGELKTKPTQHSVHTLRGMGIQPNAILCRADQTVNENERQKISLYCDVAANAVISLPTLTSVYEVPLHLEAEGLGDILTEELDLPKIKPDLDSWRAVVRVDEEERDSDITLVAVIGDIATGFSFPIPTKSLKLVSGTNRVRGNQAGISNLSWAIFYSLASFFPDKFHLLECRFICLAFDFNGFSDMMTKWFIGTTSHRR